MIYKLPYIKFIKAACIAGCFFLYACHNDYQQVQNLATKKIPTDTATNVLSYFSQNGLTKAKLTSPLMTMLQADTPKTEFPKTLHVDFYDSVKLQSKLFAKYGLYYSNKHLVFLRDSVIVFNMEGDTLRSEELWWDQERELIYTNKDVHIRKPDEKIDGTGLTANQNFSSWTITNAKGPISVPDSTLPSN
ncbi:LPS export ABC transporter periplasmic protein LptC [Parafilimonas sp.]|uniref:LPS export ABC transporter periplasmic protein LptC n=1 Tax=Parafilimonas sp. TaxID=1969739 RepID=UPI0039E72588